MDPTITYGNLELYVHFKIQSKWNKLWNLHEDSRNSVAAAAYRWDLARIIKRRKWGIGSKQETINNCA